LLVATPNVTDKTNSASPDDCGLALRCSITRSGPKGPVPYRAANSGLLWLRD